MQNVRSFANQTISFDFPVTAVIGTNGGGKSTVLGAAALAYKKVKPGDFFPKSNVSDTSMADWRIEYDLIDRSLNKSAAFSRTGKFVSARWRRDSMPDREVISIPIQRTVPANEQTKFKHFIGTSPLKNVVKQPIQTNVAKFVARILGKDTKGYSRAWLKKDPSKTILVGTSKGNDYSQFHFGAGEASIIEMVNSIESAPENSLVLIEEIENGLHPLATTKMVEYLIDVAKRRKQQVIFTTHSEHALKMLPPEAIWACIDGSAYQGKLSIESLRSLTGTYEKDRAIFVEDDFARDLCTEIIRQYAPQLFDRVEVHKAGGFPYVVEVVDHHNNNPSIKGRAVAVIDGDNPPLKQENENVLLLPDGMPESIVFGFIQENAEGVSALIQQRCQCPGVSQDQIVQKIEKVARDTTDNHLLFSKLGEELNYISEIIVRRGLCSIYVEKNKDELSYIADALQRQLG